MDEQKLKFLLIWLLLAILAIQLVLSEGQYKEQTAIEGTSYKMKCVDLSKYNLSRPFVLWAVNGEPPRGEKYKLLTDGLVIRNVSKGDTQVNYSCTILDRSNFVPVHVEKIKLKTRHRIVKQIEQGYIRTTLGNKIQVWGVLKQWKTLHCSMFSRPSPHFEWRKEGSKDFLRNMTNLYQIVDNDGSSNLTILIQDETLFGEYVCKGSNPLGESSQHFILGKGYKPKAPFVYPTFIGTDKVTFRVEYQEEPASKNSSMESLPVGYYFIQIRVNNDSNINIPTEIQENVSNETKQESGLHWITVTTVGSEDDDKPFVKKHGKGIFELKNLQENTTYFLRSAVGNVASTSDFSTPVRVTTDVSIMNTTVDEIINVPESVQQRSRKEHGRSNGDVLVTMNVAKNASEIAACVKPKYRKTVIVTTIATTLIEDVDDRRGGNSSLIKKRVVEDTTIDKIDMCSMGGMF